MNKKERFNEAFAYLKEQGAIKTQKELAEQMGTTSPNVSSALKGVESVLTDRFIERFCLAYADIFNEEWLLTGEGEMLKHSQVIHGDGNVQVAGNAHNVNAGSTIDAALGEIDTALGEIAKAHELLAKKDEQLAKRDEQMDRLLAVIEKLTDREK